jgi:hypothetical protein
METAREDDPELGELRDVMAQWMKVIGLNKDAPAKEIIQLAELRKRDEETGRVLQEYADPELHDTLSAIAGSRGGIIDNTRFGQWLRSMKGRVVTVEASGKSKKLRFESSGISNGAARWNLREVQAKVG